MRTKILKKAFRYRLVPTAAQDELLRFMAGCRRFIYNWGLARRSSFYKENLRSIPKKQLSAELTTLKADPDKLWLKDADSQMLQQALVDLDRAFASFFEKRACYPKFKNKKTDPLRFRIPQRVKVRGSEVYCPKAGWIRFRKSREVEGKVKSATFKRDVCGKWYVTLVCHIEVPDVKLPVPAPDKTVGVDAGLKVFLVLSSGERVAAPRFYRKDERKLRRAQRSLSRKERGSKNYLKARGKVARVHRKVADKRRDFLHKLSTRIVSEYDAICIEDLNLEGLARTKLAKSFTDAAHGEFRRMLEYKSEWNMKHLTVVDRYFPSTRTCGGCGSLKIALTLHDRRWECGCGAVHDRDENAAENIRREGLRILRGEMIVAEGHPETLNARGADVRPPMRRPWAWKRERPRL